MVVVIRGRQFYLWRAVDSEGEVLDFLVQSRRNARAAIRLMRKLLKKQGFAPATIVTDKLCSYGTAIRLLSYVQNLLQKGFDHVAECCRGHGWRVDIRYRSAGHAQPPSGGLLHQLAFVLRQ